jgi:polar amino acid transport system substrate-binding protein
MLQLIQHQSSGELLLAELPPPPCNDGSILVSTAYSLISAGTERTSVAKAQSSLLQRALKQPEEVRKVLESVRKDGLAATFRKVQNTLDSYKPLGYSLAGTVIESRADGFLVGDRVACAGNTYAFHAEMVSVPKNLAVKIPDGVSFEEASYTTLGAIALQGVRQARVELGMSVVVLGLGLLGQITVQLLKASGCRVIGLDVNEALFAQAREFGAEAVFASNRAALPQIEALTRGLGADAVIITAATDSNEPVELALQAVRKRGTVVVVGAVGMNLPRSPFYEKEVEFRISCSYGPGRYDTFYEEHGHDYPAAFVRWTENRNMQAFLDLVATERINVRAMTTHRFPFERADEAYTLITDKSPTRKAYSGIVLEYSRPVEERRAYSSLTSKTLQPASKLVLGVIGAGNFAQTNLLPYFKAFADTSSRDVALRVVCTQTPVKAKSVQERFGFANVEASSDAVFKDDAVNAILCASRHDSHGSYVVEALRHGKDIFVEKPLCISREELAAIDEALQSSTSPQRIMVGFNRRFSAPFQAMQRFFANRTREEPMSILYRVNAGAVPLQSWVQSPEQGGRIIGEVCHFIDCMVFLTGSLPVRVFAEAVSSANVQTHRHDTVSISLKFADGSIGTVLYFANGDSSIPKEYCEVFSGGKTAQMHNFERCSFASGKKTSEKTFDGTKGHKEEIHAFVQAIMQGTASPIPYEQIRAVTLATFAAEESLSSGDMVRL